MKSLIEHKNIALVVIFIIAIIIVAYLLGYGLINSILISLITGIITTIGKRAVEWVLDHSSMPRIKTYSDYDKSMQEIDRFLQWLVKSKKACDLATLYIRDEMDNNEFNIIANQGLYDSSPMYGPLVFDDFRLNLDKAESESFVETINSAQGENPKGFRTRENVISRASFKLADKDGSSLAALYLNWRNKQEFTDKKKKELAYYKNHIFTAVQKIEGISIKRQLLNNAELRTRRWIDYNVTQKKYKDLDELIFESIYRFLEDFDRSKLMIEIARPDADNFVIKKKDYMTSYGMPYTHRSDSNDEISDFRWVFETTRPKFLSSSLDHKNNAYKIILPIRLLSDLSKCIGVVLIECAYKPLFPEMVKPLCYLVDHFSRIEARKIFR